MTLNNRFGLSLAIIALSSFGLVGSVSAAPRQEQSSPASKAELATGTWGLDKPHCSVGFTVLHLGLSKVHGSFTDFDGVIVSDGKAPEKSSVTFTIKTASISTGEPARDNHLKSKDFFEAATYPEITFKSTKIVKRKGGFNAIGTLTMHGVSKQIVLPFTVAGPLTGMDKKTHMGIDAEITIERKDYGLTWNALIEGTKVVGEDVDIVISLDLVK